MPPAPAPSSTYQAVDRELLWGQPPVVAAALFHVVLWTLGPALFFGNLHSDTLEAAYWGRDLALGYAKHPPLATWLIDAALRPGWPPIFSLMALSQAGMAIAALFVWKTVRLYASTRTAGLAVALFLVSPSATIYAVQVNHNSLLAPFWAATMYFGVLYLEERRLRDAIFLGLAAGLGFITKYELAFLLICLVAMAGIVPRFRAAFAAPASYLSVVLFLAIIAPHVWWSYANGWPSASRAFGADKMRSVATLNLSGVNAIVGVFTLYIAPVAILYGTMSRRPHRNSVRASDVKPIGQALAFVPMIALLGGAMVTMQIVKPLWVLALASSVAAGLALLFPAGPREGGLGETASAKILAGVSLTVFAGFLAYLYIVGALGKALAAYSADTRKLALAATDMWSQRQKGPLSCLVISDRKIAAAGVLFLPGRPDFVDFSSQAWATPRQIADCRRTGAIAALAFNTSELDSFPGACRESLVRFSVPAMPGMGRLAWPIDLVYIPPEGQGCSR